MAYTQDQVNQMARDAAAKAGGTLSYDDALKAALAEGITEAQLYSALGTGVITVDPEKRADVLWNYLSSTPNATIKDVLPTAQAMNIDEASLRDMYTAVTNRGYQNQLGEGAKQADLTEALNYFTNGGALNKGLQYLNNSQSGYNYDTQDVVSAYRQALGRNPTQEEYVTAMASLGLNNFDRSSLGDGKNTTAAVAALESDPYAGRYAGYNPYQLTKDAVNISTNTLGDQVQFTNPVTQKPMIASFKNGQLVVKDGLDTMTGADAAAAVGLALATGGLTQKEYSAIQADLKAAKSMSDVYKAFSKPQAVAALDPLFGAQTGVGKTEAEAKADGAGMDEVIAGLAAGNGGKLPSNTAISGAAKTSKVPYSFDQSLYKTLYKNTDLATTKDVVTNNNFQSALSEIQKGVSDLSDYKVPMLQDGALKFDTGTNGGREWGTPETVGASNRQLMGAGNANYNSDLIKSLRQNSITPISTNPGVQMTPNAGQTTVNWTPPSGQGSAFNPQVFNPRAATPQEVNDYNAYSAYRSSSVGASEPYLSLTDWIAQGRPTRVEGAGSSSSGSDSNADPVSSNIPRP